MKRRSTNHVVATATLAFTCAAALVFAVATAQARPTHTHGSRAANGSGETNCTLVISGAPWRIRAARGILAGDKYTLTARNMSCNSLRSSVAKFTHQQGSAQIKGPSTFKCVSFSTAASGNKLLYSGACMHPPHNDPFFEWGPKVR